MKERAREWSVRVGEMSRLLGGVFLFPACLVCALCTHAATCTRDFIYASSHSSARLSPSRASSISVLSKLAPRMHQRTRLLFPLLAQLYNCHPLYSSCLLLVQVSERPFRVISKVVCLRRIMSLSGLFYRARDITSGGVCVCDLDFRCGSPYTDAIRIAYPTRKAFF